MRAFSISYGSKDRVLAILVSIFLIVGFFPAHVFAEENVNVTENNLMRRRKQLIVILIMRFATQGR